MQFASDWHLDTEPLLTEDALPAPDLFARRVFDLLARGETGGALACARVGTSGFPEYATGWYMRARAEYQVNEYRAAQASAERCLALEPTFRAAWGLLETVHVRQGRLALARAARQRLDELRAVPLAAPKDPIPSPLRAAPGTAWRPVAPPPSRAPLVLVKPPATGSFETPTLAEVYRRQGLLDRALEVYRRILERHPDDVGAQAMVRKLEDELSARRHHAEAV